LAAERTESSSGDSAEAGCGVDDNGVHFSGQTATNTAMGGGADVDRNAAEMYANGSVIFHNVTDGITT
jgi:hypothetical protein